MTGGLPSWPRRLRTPLAIVPLVVLAALVASADERSRLLYPAGFLLTQLATALVILTALRPGRLAEDRRRLTDIADVDRADTELLVAKQPLVVRRHVVLDQVSVAINLADQVGFVASYVKITMPDLTIVVWPHRVVALANMRHDMNVLGKPFRWSC